MLCLDVGIYDFGRYYLEMHVNEFRNSRKYNIPSPELLRSTSKVMKKKVSVTRPVCVT